MENRSARRGSTKAANKAAKKAKAQSVKTESVTQEEIARRCHEKLMLMRPDIASAFKTWCETNDYSDALCVVDERDGSPDIFCNWIHRAELARFLEDLGWKTNQLIVAITALVDMHAAPKRVLYLWRSITGAGTANVFSQGSDEPQSEGPSPALN